MPRMSALDMRESAALFNAEGQHVPVRLRRLQRARVLWLNQRVMRNDPRFDVAGGTADAYAAHVLDCCAFAIAADSSAASESCEVTGFADRYGGAGIGRNGGSGRAAVVNGYHVKGIGRTPLVSVLTDEAHASGGAYLEECVRETILSELVAAEFPAGSIPTLAIIETGEFQVWDTDNGPKHERRCLLVRPSFVRPAHFERAPGFISADPKEGALDAARVRQFFATAIGLWGREALVDAHQQFWLRWAGQLAYSFVHRLPHGGNTTSNICLDGRLLDFGGMAAMPSWVRATIMLGAPPTGGEMICLAQALQSQAPFLGRYVDPSFGTPQQIAQTLGMAAKRYEAVVLRELLRAVGLTRSHAQDMIAADEGGLLVKALSRVMGHYRREQITIINNDTPSPHRPWDLDQLWEASQPAHLRELRTLLEQRLGLIGSHVAPPREPRRCAIRVFAKRCALRLRTRERLYRENAKRDIYVALDGALQGDALTRQCVSDFVSESVANNRRDGAAEPEDASPIGFAQNATASYALFECSRTGQRFAMQEWSAEEPNDAVNPDERFAIAALTPRGIDFTDPARLRFEGTVALAPL